MRVSAENMDDICQKLNQFCTDKKYTQINEDVSFINPYSLFHDDVELCKYVASPSNKKNVSRNEFKKFSIERSTSFQLDDSHFGTGTKMILGKSIEFGFKSMDDRSILIDLEDEFFLDEEKQKFMVCKTSFKNHKKMSCSLHIMLDKKEKEKENNKECMMEAIPFYIFFRTSMTPIERLDLSELFGLEFLFPFPSLSALAFFLKNPKHS